MKLLRAQVPFRFYARLVLTGLTGLKARSVAELAEHLRTVPESVIYQHTHRFLQQHQHLVPEPPNDFAYWISNMAQDERLGERLTAIDTVMYNSLEGLRQALLGVLEEHLKAGINSPLVPPGRELHLMRAVRFSVPTRHEAHDLAEFAGALRKVGMSSLYLHIYEARLRPPLGVNDFSNWLGGQLGEEALAKSVANLDPYAHTMEGLRSRIAKMVEKRLEEYSRVAS